MLKPAFTLAAVGFLGFALWKVLSILMLPLIATLLGFALKIALVVALVCIAVWLFRRNRGGETAAD